MIDFSKRTLVSETAASSGQAVQCAGWVQARRNMGKIVFFDLRDRSGIVQVVVSPDQVHAYAAAKALRPEWVVEVRGTVRDRDTKNKKPTPTGNVEIQADELTILSEAVTPPFETEKSGGVNEELRLKYRYLDLRRNDMHDRLALRHRLVGHIRSFLSDRDFLEIETPILTKSTPEGARDYVVPSREFSGSFFALPQSPQQYKQLLMVAGVERYFQMARCFRDEDTRGDRQPEFTQLDLEMSFITREQVMALNEELLISLVKTVCPDKTIQDIPFPRLTYAEAMAQHKTDRPDLRTNPKDPNSLAFCWIVDFPFFEQAENTAWTFTHNPFSIPKDESIDDVLAQKNIGKILTTQFDITLNGWEIGGGSLRSHRPDLLKAVFSILGYTDQQITENFGHLLEAFTYGAPPHGGIAWGFDRLVMVLANQPNIREVIAFPKTSDGRDLAMGAPSAISQDQLRELGISLKKES